MTLLDIRQLKKIYTARIGAQSYTALNNISFTVEPGEFVAIMGPSGAGKSTLLQLIATLEQPTSGQIILNGDDITLLSEMSRTHFRRKNIGFIYQDFRLLDNLNVRENIYLPIVLNSRPPASMKKYFEEITTKLGINDVLNRYPFELSGGQQQRVAAARALITQPQLILADEPTGSLDSHTAKKFLQLLTMIHEQMHSTILLVTHSVLAASYCDRVLFINDGMIYTEIYRGNSPQNQFFNSVTRVISALENSIEQTREL